MLEILLKQLIKTSSTKLQDLEHMRLHSKISSTQRTTKFLHTKRTIRREVLLKNFHWSDLAHTTYLQQRRGRTSLLWEPLHSHRNPPRCWIVRTASYVSTLLIQWSLMTFLVCQSTWKCIQTEKTPMVPTSRPKKYLSFPTTTSISTSKKNRKAWKDR